MNFKHFFYTENLQRSEKNFFKTGRISEEGKNKILNITKGDYLTEFMCQVYLAGKDSGAELRIIYRWAKEYRKDILPIADFDDLTKLSKISDEYITNYIIGPLKYRDECLEFLKSIPRVGLRNLRNDIRKERTYIELYNLKNTLEYISMQLSQLYNRDERMRNAVMKKIFSSGIDTLEDLSNVLDDKTNLIGGEIITKAKIEKMVDSLSEWDLHIVVKNKDVWVVRVGTTQGIKAIGKNSLWCFTYGDGGANTERMFSDYSTNDLVYIIIDWKAEQKKYLDEYFMVVVIDKLRDDEEEDEDGDYHRIGFNLFNEPIDINHHISRLGLSPDIFTFEE